MANASSDESAPAHNPVAETPPEPSLAELRKILFDAERTRLENIEIRFDDDVLRAESTARIFPEALKQSVAQGNSERIGRDLSQPVLNAVRTIANEQAEELSDVMAPVMAPSIAKAIRSTLARMVESLNRTIEYSVSPRSLLWRFEAWRTGKPFAEVLLLKTLRYRVDEVFLLHRDTGVLLSHAAEPSVPHQDPDMVGAMLIAINDFAKDTFISDTDAKDNLDTLHFGGSNIWVERSASLILAAIVRGQPPLELRETLQAVLNRLTTRHRVDLTHFSGNTERFEASRGDLEDCLLQESGNGKHTGFAQYIPLILITSFAVFLIAWQIWASGRDAREMDALVEAVNARAGTAVIEAKREIGQWHMRALLDPSIAKETKEWFKRRTIGLPPVKMIWEGAIFTDDFLTARRAKQILQPPETASLSVENGILQFSGTALQSWAEPSLTAARLIPGVTSIRTDAFGIITEKISLEEIRKQLLPPAGVTLDLTSDRTLVASGIAPTWWIESTRARVQSFSDITKYDDHDLLTQDEMIRREVAHKLNPPESIRYNFIGENLVFEGSATRDWLRAANTALKNGVANIRLWDFSRVEDTDLTRFNRVADQLRNIRFLFGRGSFEITETDRPLLKKIAKTVQELIPLAKTLGDRFVVIVRGSADWEGNDALNLQLSKSRAEAVKNALIQEGIDSQLLKADAIGVTGTPDSVNTGIPRRVDVLVEIIPSDSTHE